MSSQHSWSDCEGDWFARQEFTPEDLSMSPEEYAARNAQNYETFNLHRFRFRDDSLGAWVRRVGELIDNYEELERWRQRLLTPEELAEVRRREAEGF